MNSIVIPIYNGERFLRPCLDSILSQSVRELEVICVNDGSKDGTQSILEEYAAKDPRVVVLRQENQGIAAARNSGMDRATGEYLWFFDGDDVMQPGAAEAMLHRAQETGADLVMGNYQYYHQASKEIQTPGQRVKTVVLRGNERIQAAHITPLCGCKLWRTAFLREHDVHFWALKLGEDTTFFLHGLALCETVAMLDKVQGSHLAEALERELAATAGSRSAGGTDRVQIRKSDAVAQQRARTQQAVRPR